MFVCLTNIDVDTKVLCTEAPMRSGPALPEVKGFVLEFSNESIYPIDCDAEGKYLEMPLYYGTCDDDADTSLTGVIEVLSESTYQQRKRDEFYARKPFPSWTWDESTLTWNAPFPYPTDGRFYGWSEESQLWIPYK